ncbi:hypothetical protein CDD83_10642 [Cordyceps sp. RAO-2017]|nr:hypothetical protein CDD83_10642 [Cordyceps sp. RAO-2017]
MLRVVGFGWAACGFELPVITLISAVVHTILATRHCRQQPPGSPLYERGTAVAKSLQLRLLTRRTAALRRPLGGGKGRGPGRDKGWPLEPEARQRCFCGPSPPPPPPPPPIPPPPTPHPTPPFASPPPPPPPPSPPAAAAAAVPLCLPSMRPSLWASSLA